MGVRKSKECRNISAIFPYFEISYTIRFGCWPLGCGAILMTGNCVGLAEEIMLKNQ